jgi:hypothetical protein
MGGLKDFIDNPYSETNEMVATALPEMGGLKGYSSTSTAKN